MQLHTSNIGTRLSATALGLGFLAIGIFAILASPDAPDAAVADRAFWMGATFTFAGISAVAVSWLVADLGNIWCSPPRRIFHSRRDRAPRAPKRD
jgi:hypothetical protein